MDGSFEFLLEQFILRRRAPAASGDKAVRKFHTVAAGNGFRLRCKSGFPEGAEKPISALISGKDTSSPVASMRCGGESGNQDFSMCIAETGQWFSPVIAIGKTPDFFF